MHSLWDGAVDFSEPDSEKDQKRMEQESEREGGEKSYIGTDAYNEAAKWAIGGGSSSSSSPSQPTDAAPKRKAGQKGSTDTYAQNWSAHVGEKKSK